MRQRRSWFVPALLAAAISAVGLAPAAAAQEEEPGRLAVGRLLLDPCEEVEGAWCGSLRVPFDRANPAAGTIRSTSSGTRPSRTRRARSWPWRAAPATPAPAAATTTWSCSPPAAHPQPAAGRQPRHRRLRPGQLPVPAALAPGPRRRGVRPPRWPPAATSSTPPGGCPAAASSTPATSTAPPTPPATWPTCSRPWRPGRSTCTATPTAATSARPSPPATRSGCGR